MKMQLAAERNRHAILEARIGSRNVIGKSGQRFLDDGAADTRKPRERIAPPLKPPKPKRRKVTTRPAYAGPPPTEP